MAERSENAGLSQEKPISPGEEPRDVFSMALSIAKELVQSGALRFRIDGDGDVAVALAPHVGKFLAEKNLAPPLTPEFFQALMHTEVSSLVAASTYEKPLRGIEQEIPDEVLEKQGREEFRWRLEATVKEIVPRDLNEQVSFRRNAKGQVLDRVTWEILRKDYDDTTGAVENPAFANLCIQYFEVNPNDRMLGVRTRQGILRLLAGGDSRKLVISLHDADVETLLETLANLRDHLRQARAKK